MTRFSTSRGVADSLIIRHDACRYAQHDVHVVDPKANTHLTFAVLRPTPARLSNLSRVRGTWPSKSSNSC